MECQTPEAGGRTETPSSNLVNQHSSASVKIALFRSLFRGREDVYPLRFESRRTGKSGYQPACGNEWIRGICEKPRIRCSDCPSQAFLRVTDDVIRWHLSGQDDQGRTFVIGVYPMLLDETCYFLAVDFDGDHWQEDAKAFLETCRQLEVPVALERSRSGNGAHAWFFFAEAVPARLARSLGSYLLTETMESRPDIGLRSYDRLLPNQDTLPKGGFGSLIALPLQKAPRTHGHSSFLDDQFEPYADQWVFLSAVARISRARAEAIVREAERHGRITGVRFVLPEEDEATPWTAPPSRRRTEPPIVGVVPEGLELVLGDQIYVAKENLMPALRNRLIRLAAVKTRSFTGPRGCACPRMTSLVSSPPRKIILFTLGYLGAAWGKSRNCYGR